MSAVGVRGRQVDGALCCFFDHFLSLYRLIICCECGLGYRHGIIFIECVDVLLRPLLRASIVFSFFFFFVFFLSNFVVIFLSVSAKKQSISSVFLSAYAHARTQTLTVRSVRAEIKWNFQCFNFAASLLHSQIIDCFFSFFRFD